MQDKFFSNTKKQINRFLLVGVGAVIIDFICYMILLNILAPAIAKSISFICGTFFAYFVNKYYAFEQTDKIQGEMTKFFLLYFFTLFVNVLMNSLSILSLNFFAAKGCFILKFNVVKMLSFFAATGCSAALNFLGQKYLVFKK